MVRSLCCIVWLVGCTPTGDPESPRDPAPEADEAANPVAETGPELGKLQLRDHTVTIYSDPDGPRFTVASQAGKVLLDRQSQDAFEQFFPSLFREYETSFARGTMDARIDTDIQADL